MLRTKTVKRVGLALLCLAILAGGMLGFIHFRARYLERRGLIYVQSLLETEILEHDPSVAVGSARMLLPNGEWTTAPAKKERPWPEKRLARYRRALEILRGKGDVSEPFLYNLEVGIPLPEVYDLENWPPGVLPLNVHCYWVQEEYQAKACQVALTDTRGDKLRRLEYAIAAQSNPYREGSYNYFYLKFLHHFEIPLVAAAERNALEEQSAESLKSRLLIMSSAESMEVTLVGADNITSNTVKLDVRRIRDFLEASLGSKQALNDFVRADYEDPDFRDWIAFLMSRHNILDYEDEGTAGATQGDATGADIREFVLSHQDSLVWDEAKMKWIIPENNPPSPAE